MAITVRNNTKYTISEKYYKSFFRLALKEVNLEPEASLLFVDNDTIRKYNKRYRKKDSPTDIITFDYDDTNYYAGDIIISYEWVLKHSRNDSKIKKEICMLIIHGVLHLKGIHHTYSDKSLKSNWDKMEKIYKEIIKKYKIYDNT